MKRIKKNIIFMIDAQKSASGGGKKIYEYCNYINSLEKYSSEVIHIKKKKTIKWKQSLQKFFNLPVKRKYSGWGFDQVYVVKNYFFSWFNIKVKIKNNLYFDKKKDLIILPEIFGHYGVELKKKDIEYAILVQNGYAIFSTNNFRALKESYKNAKFVIYYSKEIKKGILRAFSNCKLKLFEFVNSINFKELNFKKKINIITYMPRKLPLHSFLVVNYLREHLPKNWKIIPIDNLTSKETFLLLRKSKVFLSFSFLEGFGMPPLEAALAGNKVIGYTGEAGKEYWKEPIFTKVENGNIFNFCDKILKNLSNNNFIKISTQQREKIKKKYSINLEHNRINIFLNEIS